MATTTRTILCYGASGLGKTSQLDPISEWVAAEYQKPTLLITADGGGADPLAEVISAGLVEVFDLATEANPMPVLRDILQGKHKAVDLKRYACIAWEGVTSTAFLCLRNQTAKGRKISQDPVGLFEEGGRKFSAPPPSLYGLIQQFILDVLSIDIKYLPENIKHVYITAHESKGVDLDNNTIYGPAAVGKAITPLIAPSVGDMLHFDMLPQPANVRQTPLTQQFVAWFMQHPDPRTGICYAAKPRVPTTRRPELLEKWPNGYIPLIVNHQGLFISSVVDYLKFLNSPPSERPAALSKLLK